ncbi:unnamed protein product [Withania somnifera]
MRIAGSKEHSFAAYPFYKRTVQPRCASSGVIKKNHTPLTVSPSLNHRATLGFFPPDINELAAPHREPHRKGHPISLLWALSLVSDLSDSMNQNLELEASAGKKPIDSVFSKSTSGLEIIDPFCEPRDSDKNPTSYPPKSCSIEFQRSCSPSKRIFGVWHSQRGKQGGIPLWKGKGRFQTKDHRASFPVSKYQVPRACVRRKLPFFFLVFPCNEPKVGPIARVKGESQDYVQPGVTCQRSPSRRKGE